jgi:Zn-dependent protease/CBS domain-containing protein
MAAAWIAIMFRRGAFTLFRVRGIPVRVHWSLLLILPYIAVVFSGYFVRVASVADVPAGRLVVPPLVWGALLAVALFASVAVHELAHTFVAVRSGGKVHDITLMLIGGVSSVERMPRGWRRETLMAAAGPAMSLALAAVLFAGFALIPRAAADLRLGLFYLAQINLVLGLFNLIPAFPMDGGRVLRGVLAARMDHERATRIAARVGRFLAVLLGFAGVWIGNFLLLIIAVFVYVGARTEERQALLKGMLHELRVADVMTPDPPAIALDAALADVAARMRAAGRVELVVIDDAHHPVGLVRAGDVAQVAPAERAHLHVRDLGDRLRRAAVLAARDEPAEDALERAGAAGAEFVIAIDPAGADAPSLVGLVGPREMQQALVLGQLDRAG